jgi:autotransporter-associated beta strand protein
MQNSFHRVLLLAAVLCTAGFSSRLAAATVLWDTGAPQVFNLSSTLSYTGYSCGTLASTSTQNWVAAPFSITGGSATVTQVNADWYDPGDPNSGGTTVDYMIWRRTGLAAPTPSDLVSSGTLGTYATLGVTDPRIPQANSWLYQYPVNIPLSGGDYYLAIYAAGPGNSGSNSKLSWLAGAPLQPADLQWNGYWRSYTYPSPGFFADTPAAISPGPEMTDPLDCWNESFTLYGTPQYTTLVWVGTGGNNNWTTGGNWGGSTPAAGDVLQFGALTTGSTSNFNNLTPGTQVKGINFMFGAPSYQLTGNSLTVAGEILNLSYSGQGINLGLGLVAGGGTIDTGAAGITISGPISGTPGITKLGSGVLLLTASNGYSGGTNLIDGTLSVANSAALGSTGSLTFSGGTLQYNGISTDFSSRISPIAAGQAAYIDTDGQRVTFATSLSGSGAMVKLGAGSLTLEAAESFSGGLDVANGTVALAGAGSLLSGSNLIVGSAGEFVLPSLVAPSEDELGLASNAAAISPQAIAASAPGAAPASVPEPATFVLLLAGLFLLFPRLCPAFWRCSRRRF